MCFSRASFLDAFDIGVGLQLHGKKGCRGFGIFLFFQAGPPDLDTMWELFSIISVLEPEFCFGGIFEAILHMAKSMILLMAQKSGYHQLRLVVYPIIYMVFILHPRWFSPLAGCMGCMAKFLASGPHLHPPLPRSRIEIQTYEHSGVQDAQRFV